MGIMDFSEGFKRSSLNMQLRSAEYLKTWTKESPVFDAGRMLKPDAVSELIAGVETMASDFLQTEKKKKKKNKNKKKNSGNAAAKAVKGQGNPDRLNPGAGSTGAAPGDDRRMKADNSRLASAQRMAGVSPVHAIRQGAGNTSARSLQEAVIWAEVLGDPVSRRRRKKRVNQLYVNQGNASRR